MTQYISKDALIAEIDRLDALYHTSKSLSGELFIEELLSFINTLEVKEMDLEKEIDKFYGIYRKNGRTFSTEDNEEYLDWKVDCNPDFEIAFAKHFFELGLKVQNNN